MKHAPAIGFGCRVSWLLVAATLIVGLFAVLAVQLMRGPAWLHHGLHLATLAYVAAVIVGLLGGLPLEAEQAVDAGAGAGGDHLGPPSRP